MSVKLFLKTGRLLIKKNRRDAESAEARNEEKKRKWGDNYQCPMPNS